MDVVYADSYTASGYTPARGLLNVSAVGNVGGPLLRSLSLSAD